MKVSQFVKAKWLLAVVSLTVVGVFLVAAGCNNKPESKSSDSNSEKETSAGDDQTTSIPPSNAQTVASPAESTAKLPSRDAAPDLVCQRFMVLLQNGNRVTAEKLLTRTAFTVTSQADWQIPPVGGTAAKFEMGTVRYATTKMKLAQAECRVIDSIDGNTETSEITWMLRRKREGWRIFGMLVQLYEDKPKDLISFENPSDVAMIKETLDSQHAGTSAAPPTSTGETVATSVAGAGELLK